MFNIDQVEGLDHLEPVSLTPVRPSSSITSPPKRHWKRKHLGMQLSLVTAGARRSTVPAQDYVQIPPKATFESSKEYYGTVFHELVHATEHESRLNWSRKDKDKTYALGELIAELGGVFVCRELGVPASDDLTNHIAYLGNWLQAMKNDSRFIIMASAQASKAASYILSFSQKEEEVPEAEGELVTA